MSALAALADYGSDEDSEDSANAMDVPRAPPVVRAEPPKRKKIYVELPAAAECDDESEAQVVVTGTSVSGRGNAAASLEDRVVVNAYARRSPPPHAVGDRQTPLVTQDIPAKSTPAIPAVRRKRGMKRAAEPLFPLGDDLIQAEASAEDQLYAESIKRTVKMQRLTEAQPAHVTAIPETGDEHASSVNNNASQFIDAYSEATEPYPVSFAEGANDDDRDARHGHEMPPLDPADFDEEMRQHLGITRTAELEGVAITEVRRSDQIMSAADRATSKLDLTPNISNATFRKKHNIKWLAGYAQNLDSYLTEKREDDARKKKQTGAKYGF